MKKRILFLSLACGALLLNSCVGGSGSGGPTLKITPTSLSNGTLGLPYNQTIQVSGGSAPFTWTVVGMLPFNLQFSPNAGNIATISGTPDGLISAVKFSVEVRDSANQSATQSYTVSILPEPNTLSFTPAAGLSFGPQLVGTASPTQAATLTNTGSSPVVISSIATNGDFSQSNTCGSSLAAGAKCSLTVTFAPSQPGPRSTSITAADDTAGSPHLLSLSGIGLTSGPNASLSTSTLTFGGELVGATSPASSLTLSNYGTATLDITSIAANASFGDTYTCGASLASAASCTINVTFTPTAVGSVAGMLSVADNAPGSPQIVSLTGTGGQDALTGYCWSFSNITAICMQVKDASQCPAGQPAINPKNVNLGCFFPHNAVLVDASRPCGSLTGHTHGYCSATTH
jgi:hypothetical protein